MQDQARQHNHGHGRCKTVSVLGIALGMMATMALPVQAKIHDVKMTAVETDVDHRG